MDVADGLGSDFLSIWCSVGSLAPALIIGFSQLGHLLGLKLPRNPTFTRS